MSAAPGLCGMSREELDRLVVAWGEPRFRADQLWHWLYDRLAPDFAAMTSLPEALRSRLESATALHTATVSQHLHSADGLTEKLVLRLRDGALIETVLMHYGDPADEGGAATEETAGGSRHTVCLSTQVGCAMGCVFCATGRMGLTRGLDRAECVEQVVLCARRVRAAGGRLSNVVFMGMGEPLADVDTTAGVVETLTDPRGLAIGPRRITVSTVGVVPGIRRLAGLVRPIRLAVSLHAPDDALRERLVPANRRYPLGAVLAACRDYEAATGRRVTFEYVLIRGLNDGLEQARRLAGLLRPMRSHVNLIPLNPTPGIGYRPSRRADVVAFGRALSAGGVGVTIRMRRGTQIAAGCGQLGAAWGAGGALACPDRPAVGFAREEP